MSPALRGKNNILGFRTVRRGACIQRLSRIDSAQTYETVILLQEVCDTASVQKLSDNSRDKKSVILIAFEEPRHSESDKKSATAIAGKRNVQRHNTVQPEFERESLILPVVGWGDICFQIQSTSPLDFKAYSSLFFPNIPKDLHSLSARPNDRRVCTARGRGELFERR